MSNFYVPDIERLIRQLATHRKATHFPTNWAHRWRVVDLRNEVINCNVCTLLERRIAECRRQLNLEVKQCPPPNIT